MEKKVVKLRLGCYNYRYNDLGYYEIFCVDTGVVAGTRVDRQSALELLFELDGVYKLDPIQLQLF